MILLTNATTNFIIIHIEWIINYEFMEWILNYEFMEWILNYEFIEYVNE